MPDQPASKMIRVSTPLIESVQKLCELHRQGYTAAILQGLEQLISSIDSGCAISHTLPADSTVLAGVISDLIQRVERLEQGASGLDSSSIAERLEKVEHVIARVISDLSAQREEADSSSDDKLIAVESEPEATDTSPLSLPDPFPEAGLSTAELAQATGVTVQHINRLRRKGELHNWKGGWKAVKVNAKEHRYYPLH
ncbi:hypothetical protein H6F76_02425 [Leptolyngbya sp. FACHB-321]|uniref:hypothetical protein n=1 Tax=Leptolyngbya sp. FACHB-321 TaxID=2692807 RepID=UPI001683D544|nr:hypothetical protein [Leptolyngbya sp. FACHB-321]MBD2033909.1 hypothetical protein [Leptolyngbya sp. FACHB-321]